jgi:hypothetical protein
VDRAHGEVAMVAPRPLHALLAGAAVLALTLAGCGDGGPSEELREDKLDEDAATSDDACDTSVLPYASELVEFAPGAAAGYGQTDLPAVVLGPPTALGPDQGSLDVLSLGVGGEIVLGFGARALVDGDGPDLIVFENAFYVGGDVTQVWSELGEVAVSEDGLVWHTWPCAAGASGPPWEGCAGWTPTQAFQRCATLYLASTQTGGDAFDLAAVGLDSARFVRIRDLGTSGVAPSAGFDLDAVGLVHWELR